MFQVVCFVAVAIVSYCSGLKFHDSHFRSVAQSTLRFVGVSLFFHLLLTIGCSPSFTATAAASGGTTAILVPGVVALILVPLGLGWITTKLWTEHIANQSEQRARIERERVLQEEQQKEAKARAADVKHQAAKIKQKYETAAKTLRREKAAERRREQQTRQYDDMIEEYRIELTKAGMSDEDIAQALGELRRDLNS